MGETLILTCTLECLVKINVGKTAIGIAASSQSLIWGNTNEKKSIGEIVPFFQLGNQKLYYLLSELKFYDSLLNA